MFWYVAKRNVFSADPKTPELSDQSRRCEETTLDITSRVAVRTQGFWYPEGDNVKIPVAIKVLQDGTASRGLLDEARIMASVLHPCCVHVLAVCLASQVMLVTPLMQLGCLLDYVRKQRDNVGSKALLNWCAQIARVGLFMHLFKQEAFEKCPTANRRTPIHQVSLLSHASTVARRLRIDVNDDANDDNNNDNDNA